MFMDVEQIQESAQKDTLYMSINLPYLDMTGEDGDISKKSLNLTVPVSKSRISEECTIQGKHPSNCSLVI